MRAKAEHPEALLFFRMGDFFELFYEDAKVASRELGITLTSRSKEEEPIPMAGVPVRTAESYIFRLVRRGFRVAVCDQVQDPREARGLVDRKVVRIITAGTLTEEEALDNRAPNYILALAGGAEQVGLAWIDLSTGRFLLHQVERARLTDELSRIEPVEILLPEPPTDGDDQDPWQEVAAAGGWALSRGPSFSFTAESAFRSLSDFFGVSSLAGFGVEGLPLGVAAAGALVDYLAETQRRALPHITRVEPFRLAGIMTLDRATRTSLEITRTMREGGPEGSLLAVVDLTLSPMGARLLREWLLAPLTEPGPIGRRQEGVAWFVEQGRERRLVREQLKGMADLERIAAKVSTGRANARDLVALAASLERLPALTAAVSEPYAALLAETVAGMDTLQDLVERISGCLVDNPPVPLKEGGLVRPGYDEELDDLRSVGREGKQWMARFQAREMERTGIQSLKVGFNKVFGYYIEVSHANSEAVPTGYIRKQTLKNCERYITPELKEYETRVLKSEEMSREMEYNIFLALREEVAGGLERILATARAVALVDVIAALAELAQKRRYCRPRVEDSTRLEIRGGRHPVLETTLPADSFVPNDTSLEPPGVRVSLITGPNMAGKSTYIRQVALIVLLAQTGSFVPAESAVIGAVDRVFTRVGAADEIARGNSTFMVEMLETANILNNATERSLVILDEVGRGTSTYDGMALAWAVGEDLHGRVAARTLFATHFHELTALADELDGARNASLAVREQGQDVVFLYRLVEGGADRSYGVQVARLAGVPDHVVERAREVMGQLAGGQEAGGEKEGAMALQEISAPYLAGEGQERGVRGRGAPGRLLVPAGDEVVWAVLRELFGLDVANLTPVRALVMVNDWQQRLRGENHG